MMLSKQSYTTSLLILLEKMAARESLSLAILSNSTASIWMGL